MNLSKIQFLARRVQESPHVLLIGSGVQQFVLEQGITLCKRDYYEYARLAMPQSPFPFRHSFPSATDDCYAALVWLATHAQELGVNREHLAIAGQSAGGGICAAVGLMARDRGEVSLSFQMPLYACLDDRHITSSSHEITDARTWNRELSLKAWEAYLGSHREGDISPYAASIRATNLAGLPPTYMMIGTLDLMRDENIEYANRLMQAGVPTELHIYPGAFHGFDLMAANASANKRANNEYVSALKRALNP